MQEIEITFQVQSHMYSMRIQRKDSFPHSFVTHGFTIIKRMKERPRNVPLAVDQMNTMIQLNSSSSVYL